MDLACSRSPNNCVYIYISDRCLHAGWQGERGSWRECLSIVAAMGRRQLWYAQCCSVVVIGYDIFVYKLPRVVIK